MYDVDSDKGYLVKKNISIYFTELQDNNLKTFDAAPGAGRRVVTETF